MRAERFRTWITGLVDAGLPPQIQRQDWLETGIGDDPGVGRHTFGLVLVSPAGGTAYMTWVHGAPPGGDNHNTPEKIVEGEPPASVPVPSLAPGSDGKLSMRDLEQWLKALILNSGSREVGRVEAYSERAASDRSTHPYGLTIRWHNGGEAYGFLAYTLAPGERRRTETKYRILEAV